MKKSDYDVTRSMLRSSIIRRCDIDRRLPIRIKFAHAFWAMLPALFFYAYILTSR